MANNCNKTFRDLINDGQAQVLGIVSIVPMGDWNGTTTYQKLNYVRHNGATYLAKVANNNVEPGVAANWEDVWMLCNYDGGLVVPDGTYPDLTAGQVLYPLSFGSKTYNGSSAQTVTAADLGVASAYIPQGSITFANLPSTPSAATLSYVWDISDQFTTDSRFIEGAGQTYSAGTNVGVIEQNGNYYYDVFGSFVDLSNYAQINGTYSEMTVGAATKATQDGNGDNIADTYQKKEEGVAFALNAIELGNQSGSSNNANIDFHTDGTTKDFNSRFVAWSNTNDLEVQVGSGGSFRVPSGQTFLPNADNSSKAATTEFLQPHIMFTVFNGIATNNNYRGKVYNISTSNLDVSNGFVCVQRSGNVVTIAGWCKNRYVWRAGTAYKIMSGLPNQIEQQFGCALWASVEATGRTYGNLNTGDLYIVVNTTFGQANIPAGSYFNFSYIYITNG